MLTGHYRARYVKLRELMLDSGGGELKPRQIAPGTIHADKDLQLPRRISHARREGWKCKEWADGRGGVEERGVGS